MDAYSTYDERRDEQRLRYHWPIWYSEDFQEELSQGQMVDLSSTAASFTCYADEHCPEMGQSLTARFSVPKYGEDESFDMENFMRCGHVCRIDNVSGLLRRVAVRFAEPLPFRPGEQAAEESEAEKQLRMITM